MWFAGFESSGALLPNREGLNFLPNKGLEQEGKGLRGQLPHPAISSS